MADESKVSKEVADKVLQLIEMAKNTGDVRKGTNEATKAIERGEAKLVVIAGNVEPPEIVMHIPPLCNEKKIPYVYVPNKMELGRAAGIDVPSAAIAIADEGDGKALMKEVLKKVKVKGE
jgi:large subunit ribosomal protein L7Ae